MAKKDPREYGFEGEMVMSQLKGIMQHAQQMHDLLEPDTDLPEWVQSKVTLAYDYLQTAADYTRTEMNEDVDSYADALIKRNKGNLNKGHVVNAARIAGMDDKKLMAAVNKKVGRIKEEAPTMSAGSGKIAGMGVGPQGEPGVKPAAMNRYKKKNQAEAPKVGRKTFGLFLKGK